MLLYPTCRALWGGGWIWIGRRWFFRCWVSKTHSAFASRWNLVENGVGCKTLAEVPTTACPPVAWVKLIPKGQDLVDAPSRWRVWNKLDSCVLSGLYGQCFCGHLGCDRDQFFGVLHATSWVCCGQGPQLILCCRNWVGERCFGG